MIECAFSVVAPLEAPYVRIFHRKPRTSALALRTTGMLIPLLNYDAEASLVSAQAVTGLVYLACDTSEPRSTSVATSSPARLPAAVAAAGARGGGAAVGPYVADEGGLAAALSALDAGAAMAVVIVPVASMASPAAAVHFAETVAAAGLPASRTVLLVVGWQPDEAVAAASLAAALRGGLASAAAALWLQPALHVEIATEGASTHVAALRAAAGLSEAFRVALMLTNGASAAALAPAGVGALHAAGCDVIAPATVEQAGEVDDTPPLTKALALGASFAACARSDRADGLFATVVADECGRALGLVYSSSASLVEAVRCGRGVYYSRSRGGLWRKGDSSGAVQELLGLRLDCDADAVLFTVRQRGAPPAFCHLATRSCWGEDGGLPALQRTLQARRMAAPAGSYTRRLFDDAALLRAKLLEEAQELAEANDADHVAAEAADVIYFALVAAVRGGADLADIERHLDRRSLKLARRPGNAKPERTAAAERELAAATAAATAAASHT